jgi:hypothetical protein
VNSSKEISIAYVGAGRYEVAMWRGGKMFSNPVVTYSKLRAFKQAVKWHRRYGYQVNYTDCLGQYKDWRYNTAS